MNTEQREQGAIERMRAFLSMDAFGRTIVQSDALDAVAEVEAERDALLARLRTVEQERDEAKRLAWKARAARGVAEARVEALQRELDNSQYWADEGHRRRTEAAEEALRTIVKRHPRGCGVIHGNERKGFTCLDKQADAISQPERYTSEYGEQVRAGDHLCDVCVARAVLAPSQQEEK